MARVKLILFASDRMDKNKKEGRNENCLVRMSENARDRMGFHGNKVELWPTNPSGEDRLNRSILLEIFHAFKSDIESLNKKIARKELTEAQAKNVGFVTTKTLNKVYSKNKKNKNNIWISDDIHDTVLGTDPEFLFFMKDSDKVVSALELMTKYGEIGNDGAMAEVRPKPEVDIEKHVRNIRDIFKRHLNEEKIKEYRCLASIYHEDDSRGYPVGGHIHVGNPIQLVKQPSPVKRKLYKVMGKILDERLSVPSIRLDGFLGKGRRSSAAVHSGFGNFGDYRTDLGRLEHRTLSGIWLLHPSLAKAVLGTAKAITYEVFKRAYDRNFDKGYILPDKYNNVNLFSSSFDEWDKIPLTNDMGCTAPSKFMSDVMRASDPNVIDSDYVKKTHNEFKKMSTYKDYRKYIDAFCDILRIDHERIAKWDREIRNNWLKKKKFIVDL